MIYALEPDADNFKALEECVCQHGWKNVTAISKGVWSSETTLRFQSGEGTSSSFCHDGSIKVLTTTVDRVIGHGPCDFIKMDVEGAELEALKGAEQTILRTHPLIALSAYHRTEDLIMLPQYIKSLENRSHKKYKLYLRKHQIITELELVLYAIPA